VKELFELAVSTEGADKSVKLAAIKYIFDRIDGKPVETANMDISGVEIPVIKLPQKGLFDEEDYK
jgi:hypothetical protein